MEDYLPDLYQKSIFAIDYDNLKERGIKCLLFNVDNTIVTYRANEPSTRLVSLFDSLNQMDYKVILFSNISKKRLNDFKNRLGCECYSYKSKPKVKDFSKIMKNYLVEEPDVAIISDQMVTDIYMGNKIGITTILVNPISNKDGFIARINRKKEDKIMNKLRDNDLFIKGKYYE